MKIERQPLGRTWGAAVAAALAWPAVAAAQHVSTVVPTITPLVGGGFHYSYAITDLPTSSVNIGDIFIDIPNDVTATNLVLPTGYLSLYTPGYTPLEFASTDTAYDIHPGMTDTFSVDSLAAPGTQSYLTRSYDDFSNSTGTTLAPTAVPEPASLAAAAVIGALLVRPRRRPRA